MAAINGHQEIFKREIMNDRLLGIAALGLAAFMLWQGYGMVPAFSYEPLGPRAFPMLLGGLIGVCGLVLVFKGLYRAPATPLATNLRILLLFVFILAYGLLFQPLGFIVATALVVMAVGYLFGGRPLPLVISAVLISVGLYFLFDKLMDVVLPVGILGHWL